MSLKKQNTEKVNFKEGTKSYQVVWLRSNGCLYLSEEVWSWWEAGSAMEGGRQTTEVEDGLLAKLVLAVS